MLATLNQIRPASGNPRRESPSAGLGITFRGEQDWTVEGDALVFRGYVTVAHGQATNLRSTGGYTCRYDLTSRQTNVTLD